MEIKDISNQLTMEDNHYTGRELLSKFAHVYVIKFKESKTYKYGLSNDPLERSIVIGTGYHSKWLGLNCDYDNSFITCLMSRKEAHRLETALGKHIIHGREFWPKYLDLSCFNSAPTEWFPKSELNKGKLFLEEKGFELTVFSDYLERIKFHSGLDPIKLHAKLRESPHILNDEDSIAEIIERLNSNDEVRGKNSTFIN